MTGEFRQVEPLVIGCVEVAEYVGKREILLFDQANSIGIDEAHALRDWLNAALGEKEESKQSAGEFDGIVERLRDMLHVAERSGRTVTMTAENLREVVPAIVSLDERVKAMEAALTKIMHARRNPDVTTTDMSRADMRELAAAALSSTGEKP